MHDMITDRHIALAMPIIWMLVAGALALVLYKSSGAAFEQTIKTGEDARKLRLFGSVVIAIVLFILLAHYSPTRTIDEMAAGQARVNVLDIQRLDNELTRLNVASDELVTCVAISTVQECKHKLNGMQGRLSDLDARLEPLRRSANAPSARLGKTPVR